MTICCQERRRVGLAVQSNKALVPIALLALAVVLGFPLLDRWAVSQPYIRSVGRNKNASVEIIKSSPTVRPDELPQIAWLMTYPNSGTTYTLKLIQGYTNTTTATNYGNEQSVHGTSIPVHPWLECGPFSRFPTWDLPPRYILTKTHCGGTLMTANPQDYIETARSFEIACRSGNRMVNDTKEEVRYGMEIPKRAVHLIRNPFDNIVARLHLEEKRWERMEKLELLQAFNSTREGFRAWCKAMDSISVNKEKKSHFIDDELWEIVKDVPCHGEFIRYAWWHNHAFELTRRKHLPVHYLFYEDYADDWSKTIHELFRFLNLQPAEGAEPLGFIAGKHYENYFDKQDMVKAKELVKTLSSPETWRMVERYFS